MKFSLDKQEKYAVLSLNEENLNSMIAPDLKSEFVFLRNEGVKNLIFNLSDVHYVDSSGLSAILTANRIWKDYGSFIPGYRPGARTAAYLEQVMVRITYVGAAFLSLVAIIPTLVSSWLGVDFLVASFYGGTGLLIVVSVVLDLVNKIDSHLVMRNYSGLLESDL